MPLALRAAEHRAARRPAHGRRLGSRTRRPRPSPPPRRPPRPRSAIPGHAAAGLTEEHWLLDGALRLLASRKCGSRLPRPTRYARRAKSERILSALRVATSPGYAPQLALACCPATDWYLARVTADDTHLGAGWGPTPGGAAHRPVQAVAPRRQRHRQRRRSLSTDILLTTDEATPAALRARLTAPGPTPSAPATYRGHASRTDPVLGEIPFWYGPVEAVPTAQGGRPTMHSDTARPGDRGSAARSRRRSVRRAGGTLRRAGARVTGDGTSVSVRRGWDLAWERAQRPCGRRVGPPRICPCAIHERRGPRRTAVGAGHRCRVRRLRRGA